MGIDIAAYRGRIGTFRVSCGVNDILILYINFTRCLKYVGTVLFIGMLLLLAGVEPNPGPVTEQIKVYMSDPATSLCLSNVMDDIGMTMNAIRIWRKASLEQEIVTTLFYRMEWQDTCVFNFGSRSEGSTTLDLQPDLDVAICRHDVYVIQTQSEWENVRTNLLMVPDERTPGHCRLLLLNEDISWPEKKDLEYCDGKVYLKNTAVKPIKDDKTGMKLLGHGPTTHSNEHMDIVYLLSCKSWPKEGEDWLHKSRTNNWPTPNMLKTIEESGCFLAPVGYPDSKYNILEWRLSYVMTESILMSSLNVTQLQCLVLLKMIKKSFIKDSVGDRFSSYHCKTALLYNVENNADIVWDASNLLKCVSSCLKTLYKWLAAGNCPHLINPRLNLFVGKLSREQQVIVQKTIEKLLEGNLKCMFDIKIGHVGDRLLRSFSSLSVQTSEDYLGRILDLMQISAARLIRSHCDTHFYRYRDNCLSTEDSAHVIYINLFILFSWKRCGFIDKYSIRLMEIRGSVNEIGLARSRILSLMCATLASLEASLSIERGQPISSCTLGLYYLGMQHHEISTKLKLASAYYCSGDLENATLWLRNVEERLPSYASTFCCIEGRKKYAGPPFTLCVTFYKQERYSCPYELRFEMYRYLPGDKTYMKEDDFLWKHTAEVSPLPYMYFLQYMTYSRLHQPQIALEARDKLKTLLYIEFDQFQWSEEMQTTDKCPHLETGFNLLGQIYEREKNIYDSFRAYINSLRIRPRNNAAKWLLAKLVYSIVNSDRRDRQC